MPHEPSAPLVRSGIAPIRAVRVRALLCLLEFQINSTNGEASSSADGKHESTAVRACRARAWLPSRLLPARVPSPPPTTRPSVDHGEYFIRPPTCAVVQPEGAVDLIRPDLLDHRFD
jgi:hypothetical protein